MRIENAPLELAMWKSWMTSLWRGGDEIQIRGSPGKTGRRESAGEYRGMSVAVKRTDME